jgi:hypothetical protein
MTHLIGVIWKWVQQKAQHENSQLSTYFLRCVLKLDNTIQDRYKDRYCTKYMYYAKKKKRLKRTSSNVHYCEVTFCL